jgi:hypothetical protein
MNRSETMRVVGKILAYLGCAQRDKARQWAAVLISMLRAEGLV